MAAKLFIAVYTDEHISPKLARQLRARGYDAVSTVEAGMLGQSDNEQLEYAAREERAILTHNQKDFVKMHAEWWAQDREHWGIVITRQEWSLGELLRRTLRLLDEVTAEEMYRQIRFLSDFG